MAEPRENRRSDKDIEAMVRAACGYVCASDDLRPRVLEVARTQHAELSAQRTLRGAAGMVVIVVSLFAFLGPGARRVDDDNREPTLLETDSQAMYSRAKAKADSSGGLGWGIVDAFSELREEQSEALR